MTRERPVRLPAQPARRARGRVDPHHPRGRGRVRAAGAAVLRRQGLDRHAAPRREGVLAGARPVPGDARRHRPQLPRGARVPRPAGRRARRAARRRVGAGRRSTPAGSSRRPARRRRRNRLQTTDAARRDRGARLRRRLRRRPPRRGEGPGQGAGLLLPRRVRPVGPEEPAARAVEPLQRPAPQGRAHPGVPAVELDRARHLAVHRATRSIELPSIYFAHEREVFERDGMLLRGHRVRHAAATDEEVVRGARCATAPSATRPAPARSSPTRDTVDEVIAEVAATRITERGATRADDQFSEAAMEDRKHEGYF